MFQNFVAIIHISTITILYYILFQVTHEDERDPGEVFKRACIGLYLTHHLNLAGFFPSSYTTEQPLFDVSNHEVVTIVTLIVRHLQSCSCNAYEIDELVHDSARQSPDQVLQLGGAVFPTVSLSNHSCVPNTTRSVMSPVLIQVPIKKKFFIKILLLQILYILYLLFICVIFWIN